MLDDNNVMDWDCHIDIMMRPHTGYGSDSDLDLGVGETDEIVEWRTLTCRIRALNGIHEVAQDFHLCN